MNSPQFHLKLDDIADFTIRNIDIRVDVFKQRELLTKANKYFFDAFGNFIPTFPLNTDGIDPSGKNVLIENVYIENYDDAVAVKPSKGNNMYSNCSENIMVRNSVVKFGVGMTIGSVPPNTNFNCVRNVTFDNI